MTRALSWLLLSLVLLGLAACAPAVQDTRPKLAIVNAPTEDRERGLAERFITFLRREPEAALFGFSSESALRYQENYRDLTGSRAPLQAAFIARSQGAAYAVMVGFVSDLRLSDLSYRNGVLSVEIAVAGRARAILVDPESAQARGTFTSSPQLRYVVRRLNLDLPEGVTPESREGRAILEQAAAEVLRTLQLDAHERIFDGALTELASPVAQTVASLLTTK